MKVKKLQLQNYGRFDELTMEFAPNNDTKGNVTIIVGNNGAGKSQILRGLYTALGQFIFKLHNAHIFKTKPNNSNKKPYRQEFFDEEIINKLDFQSQEEGSCMSIDLTLEEDVFLNDSLKKFRKTDVVQYGIEIMTSYGASEKDIINKFGVYSDAIFLREIMESYKKNFQANGFLNLPIILFFSTERSFANIVEVSILEELRFNQMSGYKNSSNASTDFDSFVKWFKYREDLENSKIRLKFDKLLEKLRNNDLENARNDIELLMLQDTMMEDIQKDNQLFSVKYAIKTFMENIGDVYINRDDENISLTVVKDNKKLDVNQLSQGEKSLLALVGDIARRLAILNPSLNNPLQGEGVVLIDEVDLHLHPKWQQNLIDKLTKTFPNVQFILTTHSPHIVSDNPDVLVYILDNGELRRYNNAYGEDVNTLLNGVFGVSERTPEIAEKFKLIGDYIADKQLDNAKNLIDELSKILSKNHTQLLSTQLTWAKAKLDQSKEG